MKTAIGLESRSFVVMSLLAAVVACAVIGGCGSTTGYSGESLFPKDVATICLKMFDNRSFRRGVEYELSDALAKRIEADTPYKVVSDADAADSVLGGQITSIDESVLTMEREIGRALEKEVEVRAVVSWKNLKTGRLMIDNKTVTATASYSAFQMQDFGYASAVAANKLAQKIVELMENNW